MIRDTRMAWLAGVLAAVGSLLPWSSASAQYVQVYYPPPPVVTYSAPPPVTYSYYPSPVVQPATYYAPPVVSYYGPPVVTYSAPAPVVAYSAPVTAYYPATVTTNGIATTRSYLGFGIFRPFGVNRVTTFTPTSVQVNPPVVVYP